MGEYTELWVVRVCQVERRRGVAVDGVVVIRHRLANVPTTGTFSPKKEWHWATAIYPAKYRGTTPSATNRAMTAKR